MVIDVPVELLDEVKGCSQEDLQNLSDDGRLLASKFQDAGLMSKKLIEAGWSPQFSEWYATRLILNGPYFTLGTSARITVNEEVQEYESWLGEKNQTIRTGWWLVFIAFAIRLGAYGYLATLSPTDAGSASAGIATVAWLVSIGLIVKGLTMVLKGKGISPWFFIMGPFIFFLADQNHRTPPGKREGFVKEGEAVLSDW